MTVPVMVAAAAVCRQESELRTSHTALHPLCEEEEEEEDGAPSKR